MAILRLELFGGFTLSDDEGHEVTITSRKARALFAYLALAREPSVTRNKLASLLWADRGEEQAQASLRQTLSSLRRVLGKSGAEILRVSGGSLSISPQSLSLDVVEFEAGIIDTDEETRNAALEIHQGPLLDGFDARSEPFEDWLQMERSHLTELAIQSLQAQVTSKASAGDLETALRATRKLLSLDPLREDMHRQAMSLLQSLGRRNESLKQYQDCLSILAAELNIEPDAETKSLYDQILRQRDAIERKAQQPTIIPPSTTHPVPLVPTTKPSIAVLPFENLSDEADQQYFADGITEDIITELSRFPGLFVIARNSTFAYHQQGGSSERVHRDLGIQYVVEGSVRKAGRRIRVTAQLIEALTGRHVWAERYDRDLVDVFELQDELTRGIVAILPGRIEMHETQRVVRTPPEDMAAYELLLAGKIRHHLFTPEDNLAALELLDRAISLDASYAAAWAWKACVLGQALARGFHSEPGTLFEQAKAAVEKAVTLDENEVEAHRILAEIAIQSRRLDNATRHNDRALALNPNDPRLVAQRGELLTWLGTADQGADWIETAMRLDPYSSPMWAHLLGLAFLQLGRYTEAVDAYQKSAHQKFDQQANLTGCLHHLGLTAEAEEQGASVTTQNPDFSVSIYIDGLPYNNDADRNHHRNLLQATSLPK